MINRMMNKNIALLLMCLGVFQVNAQKNIRGSIVDSQSHAPLKSVQIVENGTTNGTLSDDNGCFSIDIKDSDTLCFSLFGYETKKESIDGSFINVYLNKKDDLISDVSALDANILYLATNDIEYKSFSEKGCSFIYPLLVLNGIVIRDKKMVDYYRNNIDKTRTNSKYVPKNKSANLNIADIPEDGVLFVTTKSDYFFEF